MTTLDHNLLNKIRSIKRLRDRAGTDGEKDAAQHKLTILLAKHKLTEADVPLDHTERRRRSYEDTFRTARQQQQDFWDMMDRLRREAQFRPRGPRHSATDDPFIRTDAPLRKSPTSRARFEKAFGGPISHTAWNVVKRAQRHSIIIYSPSNKAAYARAFYETAAYTIRARFAHLPTPYGRVKSKNAAGRQAGYYFAERVDLNLFTTP